MEFTDGNFFAVPGALILRFGRTTASLRTVEGMRSCLSLSAVEFIVMPLVLP